MTSLILVLRPERLDGDREISLHERFVQEDSMKIQEDAEDLEWLRELDSRMLEQQW